MVSSAHELASMSGLKVLKGGGNAVDAAVATALTLGVVAPAFSGIGGGGFFLIHLAKSGETLYIDYRETAPASATPDMFSHDSDGEVVDFQNSMGHRAVGVPGTIAGLTYALENYGSMKFRDVAGHAMGCARGFEVSRLLGHIMASNTDNTVEKFRRYPETGKLWLNGGRPFRTGETMVNRGYAEALELVSRDGKDEFYAGRIAKALVGEMSRGGGLIGEEDLARYSVRVRRPVTTSFRGMEVRAMPPPSSGGTAIVQLMNIFEDMDLGAMGQNSAESIGTVAKALKAVWESARGAVGDPAFVDVPVERMASKAFAKRLWFGGGERGSHQDSARKDWTTHMSVIDRERNVASITESLECYFGSGVTVPGYGFLLNDTMHDFDSSPGGINSVGPGHRPVSNMTPTLLLKDGEPYLVAGSAGGPRIVTATLQTILNVVEYGMDIQEAVDAPRFHYQGKGAIRMESRMGAEARRKLGEMGFETEVPNYVQVNPGFDLYFGGVHAVMVKDGELRGAADGRRLGVALAY